jgi:tetratricopeptide (TPR) repeat protein
LQRAEQYEQAQRFGDAEQIYRQILAASPSHPQANLGLGQMVQKLGLHEPAVQFLQAAVQSMPGNADARLSLATSLRELQKLEEAASEYEHMIRLKPGIPALHNNLGNIYKELFQAEDAERCFLAAIQLQPDFAVALSNLGAVCTERGDGEQAQRYYRQALASKPDYAKAHYYLAFTRRHVEHDEDIRAMELLYERTDTPDADRMHLAYGLGKAYEDLHQYQRAFDYFAAANRLRRMRSDYQLEKGLAFIRAMPEIFVGRALTTKIPEHRQPGTPIFVVGMPRSGTSLTEQILASHSAVFGAGELKAIQDICRSSVTDFPADLARLSSHDWIALGDKYLARLGELSAGESFFVDKMPNNFQNIGMIKRMLPGARIIHCQRNPMAVGWSCFKTHFLEDLLDYTCDLTELGTYYRHYEHLMAYWHRSLPGWIFDSEYEQLVADPEARIRELLEFCGLPFEAGCLRFHTSKRSVATASAMQVRSPIHTQSIQLWTHYEQELQPLKHALSDETLTLPNSDS